MTLLNIFDTPLNKSIIEICENLIYHGRNFSKSRDKIVIEKSLCRIRNLFENDRIELYHAAYRRGAFTAIGKD